MHPSVTKVVHVKQRRLNAQSIPEGGGWVEILELVQMTAFPTHHDLEDITNFGEGQVRIDLDEPPDLRITVNQMNSDPEKGRSGWVHLFCQPASVPRRQQQVPVVCGVSAVARTGIDVALAPFAVVALHSSAETLVLPVRSRGCCARQEEVSSRTVSSSNVCRVGATEHIAVSTPLEDYSRDV